MIKAIFSLSPAGGLGNKGKLLYRDKEDLKHFKKITEGAVVVMGRKTFEECGVLTNRLNVVLSSKLKQTGKNLVIFRAIDTLVQFCIQKAREGEDVYIIGGAELLTYFFEHNLIQEALISHFKAERVADAIIDTALLNRFVQAHQPQASKNGNFVLKRYTNFLP